MLGNRSRGDEERGKQGRETLLALLVRSILYLNALATGNDVFSVCFAALYFHGEKQLLHRDIESASAGAKNL